MTGRIAGGSALRRGAKDLNPLYRGSNQTGLRAANERLVLSLIRLHGQLSKGQIAEITGLTAQTASVIVRSLQADGYLLAGPPVRGKIGQPSVPMSLNPTGALFFGLRLGQGDAEMALVDFLGHVQADWRDGECHNDLSTAACIAATAADAMRSRLTREQVTRLQGFGIAIPASLLAGLGEIGLSRLAADFGRRLSLPVYIQAEAVAACSGELIYGLGGGIPNFLYLHVGESVSGILVQGGQLQFAASPTSPDIGRMLVPRLDGRFGPLADLSAPSSVEMSKGQTNQILGDLSCGAAYAVQATSSVISLDACILDSLLPESLRRSLTDAVRTRLRAFNPNGEILPVREGTLHHRSAALGAACLPLLSRFFMDGASTTSTFNQQRRLIR